MKCIINHNEINSNSDIITQETIGKTFLNLNIN